MAKSIDTNLLVRALVDDHPDQAMAVQDLFRDGDIVISTTVVLEAYWVLMSRYKYPKHQVLQGLRGVCLLPAVRLYEADLVFRALAWSEQGMDFADALHLASLREDDMFFSFDADLAKSARTVGAPAVHEP